VPRSTSPPMPAANGRVLRSAPPWQDGQVSVRGTATSDPSTAALSTTQIVCGHHGSPDAGGGLPRGIMWSHGDHSMVSAAPWPTR
jgi:hypothetical protein